MQMNRAKTKMSGYFQYLGPQPNIDMKKTKIDLVDPAI